MGPDVTAPVATGSGMQPARRLFGASCVHAGACRRDGALRNPRGQRRGAFLSLSLVVLVLAAFNANGAGKPHPTYPERQDVPANDAEREAKCSLLRMRTEQLGDRLGERGLLSRLDFVHVYHRSSERFLLEQCGDVDADGNALSHLAARSGKIKGSPAPVSHDGEHDSPAHPAHDASGTTEGAGPSGHEADAGHAGDAGTDQPPDDAHAGSGDAHG